MSLNSFVHDPTWLKFDGGALIGSCGLIALLGLRYIAVKRRKRDIYKPEAPLSETFGLEDADESNVRSSSPSAEKPTRRLPRRLILNAVLVLVCLSVTVSSYLFSLRNYIILSNWQEGQSRDYIGDHVGAIICYKKALRADSSLRHTHLLIGIALMKSDRASAAIPEFKAAAVGEASDPEPEGMLGDAYQILNMPNEAIEAYKRASAIAPADPMYYIGIGGCLERLHRSDVAYGAYLYAIHIKPTYLPAQMKLGALLVNSGHVDEGMAHLKRAISLAPNNMLAHSTLATAYARSKMYGDAITEYRRAIDLDAKFAVAWFNLGVTLEHMDAWERALEAFNNCTKLTPRNRAEMAAVDLSRAEVRKISARSKHS